MPSVNQGKENLWKQYKETGNVELRDRIIIEYSYLIKYIAGRLNVYFGSNVDYEDLLSYGVFGLIDAIDKFDIDKGVKFETYASLRIRGAIIDSIRELDWVPRSLRQKQKEIEKAYNELENQLGHSADDAEVAKKLGISVNELSKVLNEVSSSSMVSLEEFIEQNYEIGINSDGYNGNSSPEAFIELNELKRIIAENIENLPEKEKMVISLYYYNELTLKEISNIMKVSESRISQLHTKALMRMRGKLSRHKAILMDK